ncbi:hypothetical protein WA171_000189 [Blastocystis sp. BT1]
MPESPTNDIPDEEMKTAKIYYITGFFCLPMMWLLIVLNWWNYRKLTTEKGKRMAKYIRHALIGCIIWSIVLVVWIIVFQSGWKSNSFLASLNIVSVEGMAWQ